LLPLNAEKYCPVFDSVDVLLFVAFMILLLDVVCYFMMAQKCLVFVWSEN